MKELHIIHINHFWSSWALMSISMGRCMLPALLTVPLVGEPAGMLKKQDQKSVGTNAYSCTNTKHYLNSIKMKIKQGYGDVIKICSAYQYVSFIRGHSTSVELHCSLQWNGCCTNKSQARSLSAFPSIWKIKRNSLFIYIFFFSLETVITAASDCYFLVLMVPKKKYTLWKQTKIKRAWRRNSWGQ